MPWIALCRVAAIMSPLAMAAMSWLPISAMIRVDYPNRLAHVVAYFGTAVLARLAWRGVRIVVLLPVLVILAAGLEIGQIWIPARQASLADFIAGFSGAIFAVPILLMLAPARQALHGRDSPERLPADRPSFRQRCARLGLLSLLVIGALLTLSWVLILIWAAYLLADWAIG